MAVDEKKLEAIVSQQIDLAKVHDKHEREADRAKALDYFFGNMDKYVPPEPNRSKAVSRDLADTVGWMLPGIMRVFTASDKTAEAEPVGIEDIQFAKNATDGINHVFWKDNDGYKILYDGCWESLVHGNGVIKTYYDDTPVYKTSFHSGLTDDQIALLLSPDAEGNEPEVLQSSSTAAVIDGMPVQLHDVKIRRVDRPGRFVIDVVPNEKFLIDSEATTTEDAAFSAHWEQKMRSELVAMGYDKDEVAKIPASARNQTSEEAARETTFEYSEADASTELVDYYECYIRIDVDDDGEAELVRACYAGGENGKLLDWEVWEDEHPFDDIPCEPIPHRWAARSVADETIDIQDIKTVLIRQGLNNVYSTNNPQRFAKGKILNPEELVSPTFGGVVFGDATAEVSDLIVPNIADVSFNAIRYQDEVIQRRTGVGQSTMALDPEALQNQTATAAQNMRDAGYSQIELVARNMAECGWRKVFRKLLRLMVRHQDYARQVMANGKPVVIDPRHWNADMDVTINVGLGTGSRDRDLAMLQQILVTQQGLVDRFMAAGQAEEALDMLPRIVQTMTRMAEAAGIRNPEAYYPEYTPEKIQAIKQSVAQKSQQPDPKVIMEMEKAKADMAIKQQELQFKGQEIAMNAEIKREQLAMEMQLKREQLAAELELKREQMAAELSLKREMGYFNGAVKGAMSSDVRMGGTPG